MDVDVPVGNAKGVAEDVVAPKFAPCYNNSSIITNINPIYIFWTLNNLHKFLVTIITFSGHWRYSCLGLFFSCQSC